MRRILVETARRKRRRKHGGGRQRVDLDRRRPPAAEAPADDLLALDEALDRLAGDGPAAAELVKLRYFAGLTVERGRRGPRHLPRHRRPALGLRPGLAPAATRRHADAGPARRKNSRISVAISAPFVAL